jgi:hypothetical protein
MSLMVLSKGINSCKRENTEGILDINDEDDKQQK